MVTNHHYKTYFKVHELEFSILERTCKLPYISFPDICFTYTYEFNTLIFKVANYTRIKI